MSEWQPITTAPKDGTAILLIRDSYQPLVGCWHRSIKPRWIEGEAFDKKCSNPDCWNDYFKNTEYEPTHWMPLPKPPKP